MDLNAVGVHAAKVADRMAHGKARHNRQDRIVEDRRKEKS